MRSREIAGKEGPRHGRTYMHDNIFSLVPQLPHRTALRHTGGWIEYIGGILWMVGK